ncbi:MAG: BatA domain-containing protein [Planctomycetota bacterium]|jgi:hypothetical protein
MTFVTAGLALAGLLAMAIPILIHLLWRQRRRPVQWAAMRFLLEAFRKHRRRLQLEQLILLALRCLLLGVLGFALARPVLNAAGVLEIGGARSIYFVLDNGLASSVEMPDGRTALDHHVEQAIDTIDALEPGDFVGLITAAAPARGLITPPSSDHGAVKELLRSLEPAQSAADVPAALTELRQALDDESAERQSTLVYLLSDFRVGSAPLDRPLPAALLDLPGDVALFASTPAAQPVPNTQVVSIEPVRSVVIPGAVDGSGQITVRLARHGAQLGADVTRVRLEGEDIAVVDPKEVRWAPGKPDAEVEFAIDVAAQVDRQIALTVSIDDDLLAADNRRFAVLESRQHLRVLLIDRRSFGFEPTVERLEPGQWLRRALEPRDGGAMEVIEVEPVAIDATDLRRTDVAMLPRPDLVGMLVITPPPDAGVHQWGDRLGEVMGQPWRLQLEDVTHPGDGLALADEQTGGTLLRMIASELSSLTLPVRTFRQLPVDEAQTIGERVLRFADGSTFLLAGSPQTVPAEGDEPSATQDPAPSVSSSQGLVIYCATAPDLRWSNLPAKPIMVPLWHEIIRQGLSQIRSNRQVAVGTAGRLGLPPAATALVDPEARRIQLDGEGRPQRPLDPGGLWIAQDAGGQPVLSLAVNVDPKAARTDPQSAAAVSAWLGKSGPWSLRERDELATMLGAVQAGSPLWRTLLLLLLGIVVVETLLARWFSHARTTVGGRNTLLEEASRFSFGGVR